MRQPTQDLLTRHAESHGFKVCSADSLYLCIPFVKHTAEGRVRGHDLVPITSLKQLYVEMGY